MSPLLQWHVLTGELDDLLGDKTTKHGSHGSDGTLGVSGYLRADCLINFLYIELFSSLELFVDGLGHGDDLGEVFSVVIGVAAFLIEEAMNGTNRQVKLL